MKPILDRIVRTPGETWVAHELLVYAAAQLGRLLGPLLGEDPAIGGLIGGTIAVGLYLVKEVRERVRSWRLARTDGRAQRYDGVGDLTLPLFAWCLASLQPVAPSWGLWLAAIPAVGWVAGQVYYRLMEP